MLNIYRGRESLDKEKFIYDEIGRRGGLFTVLVPDQYTLAGERQALSRMEGDVLLDVEISSISRLGTKVLSETGDRGFNFVDKYGRHMLLSQILREKEGELQLFGIQSRKESFVAAVNDFISRAKQYELKPEDFCVEGEDEDLLSKKLSDLQLIYGAYQERIRGKLTDTEDLIDLYIERIGRSRYVAERSFFLYGFDSFTPKNLKLIGALIERAREVNVVLTYDSGCPDGELFALGELVTEKLVSEARERGSDVNIRDLKAEDPDVKTFKRVPGVQALERELFALGKPVGLSEKGVTLVKAANPYNEAESAASFVISLLREEELRYRDIVIICNDQGERASVIDRVFQEYGLDLFSDRTRPITSSPIAVYVTGLIAIVAGGYRTGDVFRFLKTGLTGVEMDEIEKLENYAAKYRIRGSLWKKPFEKGELEYGEEGLRELEEIHQKVLAPIAAFDEIYKGKKSNEEFVRAYYEYLSEDEGLAMRIRELAREQMDEGLADMAEETLQIWNMIMNAFSQIVALIGEEGFRGAKFLEMLESGLSQMEVGVLPPTADDIMLGTMQRTRAGDIKALLVLGANEGILPLAAEEEVLFSRREMERLAEEGREIGTAEQIRLMEENLAIYRNFSKAEEHLWVSYALSDGEGNELIPSELVERIKVVFPELEISQDVINRADVKERMGGEVNSLRHLTEALKLAEQGVKIEPQWKAVAEWFEREKPEKLKRVVEALEFDNVQEAIPRDITGALFHNDNGSLPEGEYSFSPSRLEKYSRCPFSHFIGYGLRPEELREYVTAGREIGDLYHEVLMRYSKRLNEEDSWSSISREASDRLVEDLVEEEGRSYREGLFNYSNNEKYWLSRAREACKLVCWTLVAQMRIGAVEDSRYEEGFRRGGRIPPIVKDVEGGRVYIEGRIDRMDRMPGSKIKIIDYKTGKESFNVNEAKAGYRLQLMLYLQAAQTEDKKPAGVFYFMISDPMVNAGKKLKAGSSLSEINEKVEEELGKYFKMRGVMVNEDDNIRSIAGDFDGYSDILPLRKVKDGIIGTSEGFLLSPDEFSGLQKAVSDVTTEICKEMLAGKIDIHPKRSGDKTPCTFCAYKGICRFDLGFKGCEYDDVK